MQNIYNLSYYQILEVPATATADEIKSSYRRLMKLYHEDKNPGDPGAKSKCQEINAANDVLSDLEQRKKYDLGLAARVRTQQQKSKPRPQPNPQTTYTNNYSTGPSFNFMAIIIVMYIIVGLFVLAAEKDDKNLN